ncbi:hypothetical protein ACFSBZ_13965 [Amnibacterium flavum]|uniref:GP-PDE domain-containing protein n=1 Tax=Amnibacterium flavum TaxID=2173173 RepID=A0A2V1HTD2_9MICO|nr:hypothetical protein [Amnibacterium flavum]PVZ95856.1 hypothetical protein DDQ50_05170 [Amnibacterium flavum]
MTIICSHRVNDPADLDNLDPRFGVEIDLHADGDQLVLVHDAFTTGPSFETWLDSYHHRFIVLNTKEEGLESRIEEILAARGLSEWAYLDQSFPFLVRTLRRGERRTMVRVSEYESVETALALDPTPHWVWVDSFHGRWPSPGDLRRLVEHGFRLMLVSPELQGRDLDAEVPMIEALLREARVPLHGVCTKRPAEWERQEADWWWN